MLNMKEKMQITKSKISGKLSIFAGIKIDFVLNLKESSSVDKCLKTVAAFANTKGGDLYIGIEKNGEIIGFSKPQLDNEISIFLREVKEHIYPKITYKIDQVLIKKNTYLIKIHISRNNLTPVFLNLSERKDVFIRDDNDNFLASPRTIVNLVYESIGFKYDYVLTKTKFKINYYSCFSKIFRKTNKTKLSKQVFSSLDFFDEDNYLRQGAVLFLDNFKGNETLIKVTKRKGIDKGESNYKLLYENNINILESIDESYEVIVENIGSYEKKLDFGRTTIYDYPLRSIFEGLVNAYAHKNYFIKDIPIEVDIFEDRLEIKSPGSLINNVNLFKETNISEISPSRRNEIIVNGLVAVKYMEKQGSGFDKISADYLEYGQNYKPYVTSTNNYFTLVLPNVNVVSGMINKNTANFDIVYDDSLMLSERQKIILKFCYFSPKSINEIASFLNMKVSSYLRNDFLNRLVNMNVLKVNRDEKAALYFTNHDTVKILSIRKENI